jgi:zinc transporter, ZIP family
MRMGLFSAGAIAIHNFPEGLATFVAAMADPQLGIAIAVAIAIHNIPEGIAISVPIYYATQEPGQGVQILVSCPGWPNR